MSRRSNSDDNAPAESFWRRVKTELLDGGSFHNLGEARLEISHYLAYDTTEERLYAALGHFAHNPIPKPFSNYVPALCGVAKPPQSSNVLGVEQRGLGKVVRGGSAAHGFGGSGGGARWV